MNPSLPHLKQKGSPSLKPACLSKTKLNPLLSFPLFLKNQKKKKKENSLTGQMGIPKPPLSDHLSLTPPHQHALPLPTQSVYTLSLFSFSSLTPLHALDAFLLLLSHLCSLYWHFFQAFPHPHNTPFLSLLIVLTIFCFHQETHKQTINLSLLSQPSLITTQYYSIDHVHHSFRLLLIMDTFFTYTPTTTTTNNTNTMSFPSTTTNTTAAAASSTPSMPSSQYYFPPHDETQTLMQFPYAYPLELVQAGQQGQAFTYPSYPFVIGMNSSQPHLVPDEQQQERRLADAWTTKVARCKRKMARQKSLCLTKDSASCASSTQMNTQGLAVYDAVDADHVQSANNVNEDPYTFRTPDNKVGLC